MSATSKTLSKRKKAPARKVLAIDFDGVIYNPTTHDLYPDTVVYLDILTKRFDVVIFSARAVNPEGLQFIRNVLQYHMIPVKDITSTKPMAALYIDDKAVHHTDWENTLSQISQRLGLPINVI
jgi:hypothetical protein